ncbi:YybH family protein [uncultured Croceitalea sp.]|uniref:YybH family protein n=1 Tax=uncultured Croceitalea sp. TaxID=1798908 RepID=UPI00374F6832
MKYLTTIILVLAVCNQVQAQTLNGNKKDIQTILKNTADFSKYVMSSNYEMIAASYTEDAKIFPNNMQILEGKDIIKYWTLPEGISTPYHKITQSEITITNDTAYDYGYYEGKTKNTKGEERTWGGKYVIVWKKINGDWKMYLDIWNNI